jgi:hypothetical protein
MVRSTIVDQWCQQTKLRSLGLSALLYIVVFSMYLYVLRSTVWYLGDFLYIYYTVGTGRL